jgi:hypothetical protein
MKQDKKDVPNHYDNQKRDQLTHNSDDLPTIAPPLSNSIVFPYGSCAPTKESGSLTGHESPKGVYKAIPKIMNDIGPIGKDGMNKAQGFKYRALDDVYNAVNPALVKNEVFILPEVIDSKSQIVQTKSGGTMKNVVLKIRYTLYHSDGSSLVSVVEGEAMDSGDKATNKAFSAAFKYMLLQVFCIPLEGEPDMDQESPAIAQKQTQTAQRQVLQSKPSQTKAQPQKPTQAKSKHQGLAGFKIPAGSLKGKELGDIPSAKLKQFLDTYMDYIAQNDIQAEPWIDKYLVPYLNLIEPVATVGSSNPFQ